MKVGYLYDSYAEKRNIIGIAKNVEYKRAYSYHYFLYCIADKFDVYMNNICTIIKKPNLYFSFYDMDLNKVDFLHFMNVVSYGSTPWITTYETVVPRYFETLNCHKGPNPDYSILKESRVIEKAIAALAKEPCRKIIALSECALEMQKSLLQYFPMYGDKIEDKLTVIHPPQPLFVNDFLEKNIPIDNTIRFFFIGRSFFRKGGLEILRAFKNIKDKYNFDIELIIVSSLEIDNYAAHEGTKEVDEAKKLISKNSNWIKFYSAISDYQVVELMKQSHVALLPTWADTYAYSVLECQASGCPVISTDVRALPEINNEKIGWIIHVPKNRFGEALYTTIEHREIMKQTIEQGLEEIIIKIFNDRRCIIKKSRNAIAHIKENHLPDNYANKICAIYNEYNYDSSPSFLQ